MIPPLLEIPTLLAAFRSGTLMPAELGNALLDRIETYADKAVFISLRDRAAIIAELEAVDLALPLAGMLFAVKDNIDVAGLPTTAACPAFAYMPEQDATVVARLRAAGAVVIGKANLDQFATGLNGTRSPYGAPRCVFDADYVSGGSSSGSAVATAAGLCVFALGTDTAGSGRVPAGFNNVIGLKPSRGRIPATGVVPACQSLDCVSVFANSATDAGLVLGIAQGFDAVDPYSRVPMDTALPARPRVGVPSASERDFAGDAAYAALYEAAVEKTAALGWELVEIDYVPFREIATLLYEDAFVAERLAAIQAFFALHDREMDPTVGSIIGGASRYDAVDVFVALTKLQALRRRTAAELGRIDVMLLPTAPTIFTVEAMLAQPIRNNATLGLYTNFVNFLDMAAVSLPGGFRDDGLPFGLTLVGPAFTDLSLLALADSLQRAISPGVGLSRQGPTARATGPEEDRLSIIVAGAHLSGMALNHELVALGARLETTACTAPFYRLFALATEPPKPGLVRDPGFAGPGIAVERWSLAPEAFARFVAALPPPMTIGKVELADGTTWPGFACESTALAGAEEITRHGGWRAFIASKVSASGDRIGSSRHE